MDKQSYERMVKNSIQGKRQKSSSSNYLRVKKEHFKNAVITLCCFSAIIGAVTMTGINALRKAVDEAVQVGTSIEEFKKEAINENTHRTQDGQHYWYDYDSIGEHVKTDEDVYLLYRNLGTTQTNKVLETVDSYDSVENFLETHNFENTNDWAKTANKQIIMQNEIEQKQEEVNKMTEEHNLESNQNENANTLGGK